MASATSKSASTPTGSGRSPARRSPRRSTTGCAPRTRCRSTRRPSDGRAEAPWRRPRRPRRSRTSWSPRWPGRTSTPTSTCVSAPVRRSDRSARAPPVRPPRGRAHSGSHGRSPSRRQGCSGRHRRSSAVRGVKPNARHHGDGLFDPLGLRCRWPGECQPGFQGVLDPAQILPTLGNGAIPAEVLTVVREAVTLDPYSGQWLARAGQPETQWKAREGRIAAEHVRLYGGEMTYDGSGAAGLLKAIQRPRAAATSWSDVSESSVDSATQLSVELANFSYLAGAAPSPVRRHHMASAVGAAVRGVEGPRPTGATRSTGWSLDGLDLVAAAGATRGDGRSDVHRTQPGLDRYRQVARRGDDGMARRRERPRRRHTEPVAAQRSRRGVVREVRATCSHRSTSCRRRSTASASNCSASTISREPWSARFPTTIPRRHPVRSPPICRSLLFGGTIDVLELRAVDAFGRTLPIPVDEMRTTATLEVAGTPGAIAIPPRVQHGARWLFRLDRSRPPADRRPCRRRRGVRRPDGRRRGVTPIAGFLLPDHMDESLEFFDRDGKPIGELIHDAVSDAVAWEPAPGPARAARRGPDDRHARRVRCTARNTRRCSPLA